MMPIPPPVAKAEDVEYVEGHKVITTNIDRLRMAGFEIAPDAPKEYLDVINDMSPEAIDVLIHTKQQLGETQDKLGLDAMPYMQALVPL